jgi:hypothetical protein
LKKAGRTDPLAHLAARTDVVAVEALNRAATLADWTGARIHIVHESCAASIPFIAFWKGRGCDITVETLPQYLYLDAETLRRTRRPPDADEPADSAEKPPGAALGGASGRHHRFRRDRSCPACRRGEGGQHDLGHGLRLSGGADLADADAAGGAGGADDPAGGRARHGGAPARTFGLSDRKGAIAPGMDADLVVVDMDMQETLGAERLLSRGKVSVYEGWEVTGVPVMTFLRGTLVAENGAIIDDTPRGRMQRPRMPPPAPRNLATTMQAILRPGNVPWDDSAGTERSRAGAGLPTGCSGHINRSNRA